MLVTSWPFCGVGTNRPHETQEACIAALHGEIARMRQVVSRLSVLAGGEVSGDDPNPPGPGEDRH
jgi:hypothetical protein